MKGLLLRPFSCYYYSIVVVVAAAAVVVVIQALIFLILLLVFLDSLDFLVHDPYFWLSSYEA